MNAGTRIAVVTIGAGLAWLGAGCTHEVSFDSDPPGARIMVNNNFIGVTPCRSSFKLNMESTLKESYEVLAHPPEGVTEVPTQYRYLARWEEPPERMFFYFRPRREGP